MLDYNRGKVDGYKVERLIKTIERGNKMDKLEMARELFNNPKLKQFDFGEAYWIYRNSKKIDVLALRSCVSGRNYKSLRCASILALKGKWTIEGFYEEEQS